MTAAFSGSEALRRGELTEYQLRTKFEAVHRDVFVPAFTEPSLATRARAAWLWSKRRATVAGLAAAALHGARWVADDEPIELIWRNQHAPNGVITRNERLAQDEVVVLNGVAVTSAARTAFDLGRLGRVEDAVARLDALTNATAVGATDVEPLLLRYRGVRGIKQLRRALELTDPGGSSPKETWLRLLLIDDGLPKPVTQLMVHNGDHYPLAYLDMGWEQWMVAVEYDGDQHRSDRKQYVKDISRLRMLERRGWIVIRVVAEDHPLDVLDRVRKALVSRGFRDTSTAAATRR